MARNVVSGSARPLSISIIGWVMILCGLFALPLAFVHVPLSLFGMMLGGWIAMTGILVLAFAYLLIGYGLLKLKPDARIAGIALFALFGLNGLVISFIPDTHAKMLNNMKDTPILSRQAYRPTPPPTPLSRALRIPLIAVVFGVPLWFLVSRKPAFVQKHSASLS